MVKLNFGSGLNPKKGFINLDIDSSYVKRFPDYDVREWDFRSGLREFDDKSVDAATESHSLMYLRREEYQKFLSEVYRVLKKGGVFRVTGDDCENPDCGKYGLPWHGPGLESGPISLTGPKMMREELEKVGFEVHNTPKWGKTLWIDNSLCQLFHGSPPRIFWLEAVKR